MGSEIVLTADRSGGAPGARGHDCRGRVYDAESGANLFTTLEPPNTGLPDRVMFCQTGNLQAPCVSSEHDNALYARSYHPGGVNGLMGDGAVRFVSDNVDRILLLALGSRNGKEVMDGF